MRRTILCPMCSGDFLPNGFRRDEWEPTPKDGMRYICGCEMKTGQWIRFCTFTVLKMTNEADTILFRKGKGIKDSIKHIMADDDVEAFVQLLDNLNGNIKSRIYTIEALVDTIDYLSENR